QLLSYPPAELGHARCGLAMFVDQAALLRLEVFDCVFEGGQDLDVFEILDSRSSGSARGFRNRAIGQIGSRHRHLRKTRIKLAAGLCLFAPQCPLAVASFGPRRAKIVARVRARDLSHSGIRAAERTDARLQSGTVPLCRALVASDTETHRIRSI